ncbi:MAG: NAD(P)H-dependent oxidoreductase [Actinobacteria bacterium RBG_16_64_13]|nr:MAG: NAD(P)H-dependent oxidoreductase [Actinobacteria bacterium RBG_16_64_13]
MEFREAIMRRYATKRFDGRQIPQDKIEELLEIVRWAPSGLNIQPWRIKVVSNAGLKEELSAAAWDEPQIKSCSHLLVFCADTDYAGLVAKLLPAMKEAGVPEKVCEIVKGIAEEMGHMPPASWLTYAKCQVHLAVSYAILGAKDLGFDSCPMTHFEPDEFARILEIPANLVPTLLCPVGYAADQAPPKWRYPKEDLLLP